MDSSAGTSFCLPQGGEETKDTERNAELGQSLTLYFGSWAQRPATERRTRLCFSALALALPSTGDTARRVVSREVWAAFQHETRQPRKIYI